MELWGKNNMKHSCNIPEAGIHVFKNGNIPIFFLHNSNLQIS